MAFSGASAPRATPSASTVVISMIPINPRTAQIASLMFNACRWAARRIMATSGQSQNDPFIAGETNWPVVSIVTGAGLGDRSPKP